MKNLLSIFLGAVLLIVSGFGIVVIKSIYENNRIKRKRRDLNPKEFRESGFKKVLTACGGDKSQANRLIDFEINRDRRITTEEAAKRVIERLVRDRK